MRILTVFGTRPEAIKMAPVVRALRAHPELEVTVCSTGQHREMLRPILDLFEISPDHDLDLMTHRQTLPELSAKVLTALPAVLDTVKPDYLLVQGDTTTAMTAALAAFYAGVPVGHVEAGLRTYDLAQPWPEELNRQLVSRIASLHFAPTRAAADNLLREQTPADRVTITGNTVIDAVLWARDRVAEDPPESSAYVPQPGRRFVLVTGHRRENFGAGFREICTALAGLADDHPEIDFVYPVHLNPNVREPVHEYLGGRENIRLIEPASYPEFVYLMSRCTLILTDSGGIQEEAPSLGKPVLVMREVTERPEGVEAGTVTLVGADAGRITSCVSELLSSEEAYRRMSRAHNPYGDGHAAERIAEILAQELAR